MSRRSMNRIFHRFAVDDDVARELRTHLEMCVEELKGDGWTEKDAWNEAHRRLGNETRIRGECITIERKRQKRARSLERMDGMLMDVRYALRTLRKSPAFFLVAILTLGLGIGANATVFSLVNGVLLTPMDYDRSHELVSVAERSDTGHPNWVAWSNFVDWREGSRSFRGLAAWAGRPATVIGGEQPVFTRVATVSQDFWKVFPVVPLAGRLTAPSDHVEDGAPVALVSEGVASEVLGGPEAALGKLVGLMGTWHEVVGVIPDGLDYPYGSEIWTPAERTPKSLSRSSHNWQVVGRLHEGLTPADATMELDPLTVRLVASSLAEDGPEYLATGTVVRTLQDQLVGDADTALFLLLGAAAFVLLVACTNLASTLLARGTTRARELAVRSAMGADRNRIVRQLLSEAGLMALIGGAAGMGLTGLALDVIRGTATHSIPRLETVRLDGTVFLFTMGVSVLTALIFGLLPALRARENDQARVLRAEGRGNDGYRRRIWGTLIAAEVALALVLLAGSGLLIRSFTAVLSEEAGFDGEDVVYSGLALSEIKYPELDDHRVFWEDLLARAEALPGVAAAGMMRSLPLSGGTPNGRVALNGDPSQTGSANYLVASGGAFDALDIPLLQGRVFDATDGPAAPHAVVVNRSFAETYWPKQDPIGKQVSAGGMDDYWDADPPVFGTVVGVVADVRYRALTLEGGPAVYWNYRQRPFRIQSGANLVVESAAGDPVALAGDLRQILREVDPDVAPRIQMMGDHVDESLAPRRFTLLVMSGFAGIALLLAAVGIYGVVSYAVARRTREMGIRLALGATGGSVRGMVLGSAMVPVVVGLTFGTVGALALARIMRRFLYQVTPGDPIVLAGGFFLLLATALVATWIPTRRGTRIDPMLAMRAE